VFSLSCTFLVVPRNYHLSTLQLRFQGIYTPLQWSSGDVRSQIEVKFEKNIKMGTLIEGEPKECFIYLHV
jgi:hypothetical protein